MDKTNIPRSAEAEQAVLGGLMLDNDRWDEVVLLLAPDDFFVGWHRAIYRAMAELVGESLPLDLITLSDRMENAGLLERVGGFAYLAELSKNTPSAANILAYAGVVAEKSRLRKLQSVGNMLVADVQALNARSSDVLEVAENQLFCIAEQGMLQAGTETTVNDAMDKLVSRLEAMMALDGLTGTPTGFSQLDEMTCGLQPGDLVLLAARPSMGKTALALATCAAAVRGKPDDYVFVYSMEMPEEQLSMRLMSMEGRVELSRLRSVSLGDEEWARLSQAMKEIIQWNNRLIICTSSDLI